MNEEEPIKIIIPVEEEPVHRPEQKDTGVAEQAGELRQRVTDAAAKAWNNDARRRATERVNEKISAAAASGTRYVRDRAAQAAERQTQEAVDAVRNRVSEVDWQAEAKAGVSTGMKWLSERLRTLAEQITPEPKPPQQADAETKKGE